MYVMLLLDEVSGISLKQTIKYENIGMDKIIMGSS